MGQLIDGQANERDGYAWTLARAKADGNAVAVGELEALAPYPGKTDIAKLDIERKWSVYTARWHGDAATPISIYTLAGCPRNTRRLIAARSTPVARFRCR